ncbi:glycoside hydrolase [Truncatella angustata]|uniref:Mannan endo-1,6-alpha-mannosidase n=1 Tax=Truncatella angustata TaxID=152316 RepID=A0A9P8RJG6_9PEZI|nr:glycoside hydrolase [Truncatella angustata]KAH6647184.1 glycoside hydrolase [Truncatella angustata]
MIRISHLIAGLATASISTALDLNTSDTASIKDTAAEIAKVLYLYHNAESTAGDFNQPQPWFWWLSGNGWNGLLDYTVYTGDTTYQADFLVAIAENIGDNRDFVPESQYGWEANDDQAYWVYNALTALEYGFEPLPCDEKAADGTCLNSWLALSTNAFNLFASRYEADSGTCNGGLKWQYRTTESGYYYKNSVTNAGFFQTAARLARYTGNQTFADWATKVWDWSSGVGFVTADFHVFDGAGDKDGANCTGINQDQWSYNIASYLHGAAHMYAYSEDGSDAKALWESRVQGLVSAAKITFFGPTTDAPDVMYEQKCELSKGCTTDQTSFKSSLSRWLGKTAVLVPSVSDTIFELLEASAKGAAASCTGYSNSTCGSQWYTGSFNSQSDFGVELSALEIVQSLLVKSAPDFAVASKS